MTAMPVKHWDQAQLPCRESRYCSSNLVFVKLDLPTRTSPLSSLASLWHDYNLGKSPKSALRKLLLACL